MPTLRNTAGLVTFPSEINKREGSLEIADNVVIDAEDTIETRRGFTDFGTSFATTDDRLKQLMVYKGRIFRHYDSTLEFDNDGTGNFSAFSGSYSELETGLRIKFLETSGNFYFTTDSGIKKISATSASNFSTASGYITDAGGVKATDLDAQLLFNDGGFLPANSKCAYRVVWGIRDNNNNLILGTPSPRVVLTNNSTDINTPEQFDLTFTSGTVTDYDGTADDRYVLLNSANVGYYLWFSSTAFPSAPQSSDTINRTPLEVPIEGLSTSGDIAVAAAAVISTIAEFTAQVSGSIVSVTSTEEGEDLIDASASAALTAVTVTIIEQGSISEGSPANADIVITVPSGITSTDYFYQLYRTAPVTATEEVSLIDLDPGDEMNLAFEANITSAEIGSGEVVFTDTTTESFRSSGAFLYTNPNTGEGILQANERPPIAKDIALFRNTTFYANTKTAHRKQFNLLSVANLTSGSSKFIIADSSGKVEYTFVGEAEITDVTCDDYATTVDTGYILINSARDERKYYIWFDKGSTSDPAVANRVGLRVFIESGDTASDVAQKLSDTLAFITDFTATNVGSVVTITNIKNGNTTDASIGAALGGAWAVSVTTQGDGEDDASNEVLLSSISSIGQAIEETSLSLIKVINKDASSPVNAFYLSGADDVPGIILLERKALTDEAFYAGTNDSAISTSFNPELPVEQTITAISASDPTEITSSAAHGLSSNNEIIIYNTDSTPVITGTKTVTVTGATTFTVPVAVTIAGTTGSFFKTSFSSDNEVSQNRLYYSKENQPEAVPILNYINIGPKDKGIQRILALRDNLFVLKEDAVYIVTGTTAPNFGSRLLDNSTQITAPDSAALLSNKIYCLTTQGIVNITESGARIVSRAIENKLLDVTNVRYNFSTVSFGVAYETDRSYFLWLPTSTTDTVATQCYRYNTFTNTWTRWTKAATCGIVNSQDDKLHIGDGTRNYSQQERKLRDRTDYSDRDFEVTIAADSVEDAVIELSSLTDIEVGDVFLQTQYVTISKFNRLLKKLDIDAGLDDTDYFSTLNAISGDDMKDKLDSLNTKLVSDDASGTVTARIFSIDFATQQTEYNLQIDELNNVAADTNLKNYKQSEGTIQYESIISSIDITNNKITVINELPLIEGPSTIFKGIDMDVQWAPQHFGSPETLKQVREGTVIFDQNKFYSATVSYSSDRSANFEKIAFTTRGPGYWGGFDWGEATWGGDGNEIPIRTLVPRDKQRCRHIKVRFEHINARENVRILGYSLEPRQLSTRAYR